MAQGRVGHRWGRTKGKIGFQVARLLCIARGCAVTTAMKLRCRPRKSVLDMPREWERLADQEERATDLGREK